MLRRIRDSWILTRLFLLVLILSTVGAVSAFSLELKIASIAPENSPYGAALNQLAADWERISGGQVQVRIYSNGIAGDQSDVFRKIRIGQLQGGVFTNTAIAAVVPQVLSISVPFLVRNDSEFQYVMNDIRPFLNEKLAAQGFKGLAWAEVGWVRFFSTSRLTTPEQLKSMRVAVPPDQGAFSTAFKLLGYRPVPIDIPETLSALNSGLVDVIWTSPLVVAGYQWFGVANYMLNLNIAPAIGCIVLSERAWNRIPANFRPQFEAAARKAEAKIQDGLKSLEENAVSIMQKYGLHITVATPAIRNDWVSTFEKHFNDIVGPVFDRPTFERVVQDLKVFRSQ